MTPDDSEDNGEARPVYPDSGPGREEMTAAYLPESDDWPAKTVLDVGDPAAISALSQLGRMYPEVDDLQPMIDEFLEQFLKTRTSVAGDSRTEYMKILTSMYGGNLDEDTARGAFVDALASDLDDD